MDVRVSRPGTGRIEIAVSGEVDISSAESLAHSLRAAATAPLDTVVVDLTHVAFLDSSGVRALLQGRSAVSAVGAQLTVRNPQPAVRRVLEITGVDRLLGLGRS